MPPTTGPRTIAPVPQPRVAPDGAGSGARGPARAVLGELPVPVLDLAVAVTTAAGRAGLRAARVGGRLVAPAAPLLQRVLDPLVDSGRRRRRDVTAAVVAAWPSLVPHLLDAVLDQVDLTQLVADRVDLDVLAGRIDLDAAVARVDVDAVVARVDLERIVERLPIDQVLARIDLDAVAATLDVDAIVARVDLLELARYVIDGVDLPEIIRGSTGAMASEGVRGVRMQSIEADERLGRLVDRALLRHHGRRTEGPPGPQADEGHRP